MGICSLIRYTEGPLYSHGALLPSTHGDALQGGSSGSCGARRNGRAFASLTARGGGLPIGVILGLELDKDCASEEVVRGLVNAEAVNKYDTLQVSDRTQVQALFNTPFDRLIIREGPRGRLQVAIEEPELSFLRLRCDAPDVYPVDGIPKIRADGASLTTITAQKVDEGGKSQRSISDNDLLSLRTDYGTLFNADGKKEITSIKLRRGQAAFRLVSETTRRVATVQVFNADANLQNRSIRIEFI
jgi:hypothetical protein